MIFLQISVFSMILHNVPKPHTNSIIRNLLKTHFVKTKRITMRRDIEEFFVSPEHLDKCSYEVLTQHYRYIMLIIRCTSHSYAELVFTTFKNK